MAAIYKRPACFLRNADQVVDHGVLPLHRMIPAVRAIVSANSTAASGTWSCP